MKTLPFFLFTALLLQRVTGQPLIFPVDATPLVDGSDIPADVIQRVDPSVVSIQHERAGGTGFIISDEGYILTNGHVVQGIDAEDPTRPARSITVVLHDERTFPATVLGFSMDPDVALLKINAGEPLSPVEFADSRSVSVGQRSFAVGTPIGLRRTFTSGILSNIERTDLGTETVVFQTDAAINQGNSGGPLFDMRGRVLGINTYGGRRTNNIGFTIPIHVALDMVDDFKTHGRFVRSLVPFFFTGELYDELARTFGVERGILISYVMPGSSAWESGLRPGDILVEVDGEPVSARNRAQLLNFEWRHTVRPAGEPIHMRVLRGRDEERHEVEIHAKLEALDPIPRFGRHLGEIPEYRYATLGLGVKSVVPLHTIIHELPDEEGVLVRHLESNSTAAKAGIEANDIITHVAGTRVTSLREFQNVFEAELTRRNPAIDLRITRRRLRVRTAMAPDYPMSRVAVALIAPEENSEYVDLMRRELLAMGASISIVTPDGGEVKRDLLDRPLPADKALADLDVSKYDVILFAGGSGSRAFWENEEALRVAREAFEQKRHLAAAGPAALLPVLASPEQPLESKITLPRDDSAEAVSRGATYTGQDVESDGRIHTTTAQEREIVRDFLIAIQRASIRSPARELAGGSP